MIPLQVFQPSGEFILPPVTRPYLFLYAHTHTHIIQLYVARFVSSLLTPHISSSSAYPISIRWGQCKQYAREYILCCYDFIVIFTRLNRTQKIEWKTSTLSLHFVVFGHSRLCVRFDIVSPASMPLIMLLSKQTVDEIILDGWVSGRDNTHSI